MRKKLLAVISLLLTVTVLFSGCGAFSFNSAENLVRPPKLSGDDGALQAAFEYAVSDKGEYILKYPSAGEYRSAYVRYDCDADGTDEAFVFYSLKTEAMSVYMVMLDYANGEWNAVGEVPGEGSDIYSIEFCDLNNDGIAEVLVGWSSLDAKSNKKLAVYCSYKNSQNLNYRVLAIESYTSMYTVDLDNDGEKEILLALISSTSDIYTTEARLLKMTDHAPSDFQMNPVGQVSLYSETTAITAITSCEQNRKNYVYIDEAAGDTYLTEILYWDPEQNTLVAPLQVDMLSIASCPTSRSLALGCTDINEDGIPEIPSTALIPDSRVVRKTPSESDVPVQEENVYVVHWKQYENGQFRTVSSFINNCYDAFKLKYDETTMADWSVMIYPDSHLTQFFELRKSQTPEQTDESVLLFSIQAVEPHETVSIGAYLMTGDEYKYTYEITQEGENAGITKSFIASAFSFSDY